ncbi:MAG: WG repeat-containing protein [Eubacteriales bacterium]
MKKYIMTALKIICAAIPVALCAAVILYLRGYYTFTFLPDDALTSYSAESETSAADTYTDDYTEPAVSPDNLSNITDENVIDISEDTTAQQSAAPDKTAQNVKTYSEMLASVQKAPPLYSQGWTLTGSDYSRDTHIVAAVTSASKLPAKLSYRKKTFESVDYTNGTVKTEGAVPTVSVTKTRYAIENYMGWLIYDDGSSLTLAGADGKKLMSSFEVCTPAYMRDQYGHPLFYYGGGLYYVGAEGGGYKLIPSGYDPLFAPSLSFSYPEDYGVSASGLYRYYVEQKIQYVENQTAIDAAVAKGNEPPEAVIAEEEGRLWGYMNKNGSVIIEAQYYYAGDFNENGLAVVADRDRNMKIIDTRGSTVLDPYGTVLYLAELNRRPMIDSFRLPDTFGAENLGMFRFDGGYMRVRRALIDYYDHSNIASSEDILIDASGARFDIPGGYKLIYYSDSVLILEKDGRYGAYSTKGRWIAQPIYTYASFFSEGLCAIGFDGGKKGVIDTDGNIVLPFAFDYITDCSGGVIAAYENANGWSIYNKMAKPAK